MDGAASFRKFVSITLPMLSPTTFYLCIVRLIAAFKAFSAINIMGVSTSAPSLVTEIYGNAFNSYKFGYASAEAWVQQIFEDLRQLGLPAHRPGGYPGG